MDTPVRPTTQVQSALNSTAQVENTDIYGALFLPLRIIPANGGAVLHFLRRDSPLLPDFAGGFGEIYFSEVEAGAVKAWKRHRLQTQLFAVPGGRAKIVLYDGRADSPTAGNRLERVLGRPDHYGLLRIPCGVWYGFAALGRHPALICNCADIPHDPAEGERLPPDDPAIPYDWQNSAGRF
ncbi:MAG: dTDP-4-dehydrorhamnose 3,5-epimerase family protein [Desulfovibrio sp.]|jgi:dTDP-4-dehydrorhamnose 3,5-epimerase|nr:dTDP-4-dehydrorhamnose 3,5-epimerase family protein [Desulfovibrio sp.]